MAALFKRFTIRQSIRPKAKKPSLQALICEVFHEQAMQEATVLFYNKPLLELQKEQGLIPKRAKTFEHIYGAIMKNHFEKKRMQLELPKRASREKIAEAMAKSMQWSAE